MQLMSSGDWWLHFKTVSIFCQWHPVGMCLVCVCGVLVWLQDNQTQPRTAAQLFLARAFPRDHCNHYFTWPLQRVRSQEEEMPDSSKGYFLCVFLPATGTFSRLWTAVELHGCDLASKQSLAQLMSPPSSVACLQLCLCCPCAQAWDQASTLAHLDLFWSHGCRDFQGFSVQSTAKGIHTNRQASFEIPPPHTSYSLDLAACGPATIGPGTFFFGEKTSQYSNRFCTVLKSGENQINQFLLAAVTQVLCIVQLYSVSFLSLMLHFCSSCS